jgi:hypothetical protein
MCGIAPYSFHRPRSADILSLTSHQPIMQPVLARETHSHRYPQPSLSTRAAAYKHATCNKQRAMQHATQLATCDVQHTLCGQRRMQYQHAKFSMQHSMRRAKCNIQLCAEPACNCRACTCARGRICVPSLVLHVWYRPVPRAHARSILACAHATAYLHLACRMLHLAYRSGTAAAGRGATGAVHSAGENQRSTV